MKSWHLILVSVLLMAAIGLLQPMPSEDGGNRFSDKKDIQKQYAESENTDNIKIDSDLFTDKLKLIGTIVELNRNYSQALFLVDGRTTISRQVNEEVIPGITLRLIDQQNVIVDVAGKLAQIKLANSRSVGVDGLANSKINNGKRLEIGRAPTPDRDTNEYDQTQQSINVRGTEPGKHVAIGRKPDENHLQNLDHREIVDKSYSSDPGMQVTIGKPVSSDNILEEGSLLTPEDLKYSGSE